jgi:hypothetical protein
LRFPYTLKNQFQPTFAQEREEGVKTISAVVVSDCDFCLNYVQEFGLYATPYLMFLLTKRETLPLAPSPSSLNRPEAEFLDEIDTKVPRVFFLAIHTYLYSFALRFLFLQTHTTSYVYLQTHATSISTVQLLFTVKEKGGNLKENHTPFPMVSEIYRETSSLRILKIMPRKLNKIVRSLNSASEIGKSCAICKKCPCSMNKDMSEPTLTIRDFQFSSSTTCSFFVSKT